MIAPSDQPQAKDQPDTTFVARQPVFDREMKIWGYELLYRNASGEGTARFTDGDVATSNVIADGVSLGRTGLKPGEKTLINFPTNLLLQGFGFALPPESCVVEILETVEPTPQVVRALKNLKAAGYLLALDDFVGQPGQEAFLELADIVKVDVLQAGPDRLPGVVAALKASGRRLLAEKVETEAMHQKTLDLGFSLFQGYFFRSPELLKSRKLEASETAKMQLLKTLSDEDFDPEAVGEIVEKDLSLSYRLLRYINSASFGRRELVSSLRQASMILGQRNLAKWLQAVLMADLNPTPKGRELVFFSVFRAKFLEMLSKGMESPPAKPDQFFLLGLFSLLDVLLGKPMGEVLEELPLVPAIDKALRGERTDVRELLELVRNLEDADWPSARELAHGLNLATAEVSAMHRDSLRYAGAMVQDIHACPIPQTERKKS